jgi:hypothetical protein
MPNQVLNLIQDLTISASLHTTFFLIRDPEIIDRDPEINSG